MCEILSRGKLWNSGEWIEGYYVHLYDGRGNESHRIYTGYAETDCGEFYPVWGEVDPDTVGRYTGLTDENGVKVFEGDIAQYDDELVVVEWDYDDAMFYVRSLDGTNWTTNFSEISGRNLVVVGNIHDDPGLLKEYRHG